MDDTKLARLIAHYQRHFARGRLAMIQRFRSMPDFQSAVTQALGATDERGKIESHQRRVGRVRLRRFVVAATEQAARIKRCRSFEELHELLWSLRPSRVGKLAVYDAAVKLGAYLGLEPRSVYLHAGASKGACALGLRGEKGILAVDAIPGPLRALKPDDVENCLCIYKEALAGGPLPEPRGGCEEGADGGCPPRKATKRKRTIC